jgi:serine O-acetyltransferase
MFDNLRADFRQAAKINLSRNDKFKMLWILIKPGTFPVVTYRFGRWARSVRIPVVRLILILIANVARYVVELLTGVFIASGAEIGPGFVVHTWYGIFIGAVKIGSNCVVQHGVVIGWSTKEIGNNVYFGPGAKVMGTPKIGNNVVVVANSLVMTDVPDDTTIVGVPARISLPRGNTLKYPNDGPEKKADAEAIQEKKQPAPEPILKP